MPPPRHRPAPEQHPPADRNAVAELLDRTSIRRRSGPNSGLRCSTTDWNAGYAGGAGGPGVRRRSAGPRNGRSPAGGHRRYGDGIPCPAAPAGSAHLGEQQFRARCRPRPGATPSGAAMTLPPRKSQPSSVPGVVGVGHRQLVLQCPGPDQHLRHGIEAARRGPSAPAAGRRRARRRPRDRLGELHVVADDQRGLEPVEVHDAGGWRPRGLNAWRSSGPKRWTLA